MLNKNSELARSYKEAYDRLKEKRDEKMTEAADEIRIIEAKRDEACNPLNIAMDQIKQLIDELKVDGIEESPVINQSQLELAIERGYPKDGERPDKTRWIAENILKKVFIEKKMQDVYADFNEGASIHAFLFAQRKKENWFTFEFRGDKLAYWCLPEWTYLDGLVRRIKPEYIPSEYINKAYTLKA